MLPENTKNVLGYFADLRGKVGEVKGKITKLDSYIEETEERILDLENLTKKDSKLNKRLESILVIRKIILEYAAKEEPHWQNPLKTAFLKDLSC